MTFKIGMKVRVTSDEFKSRYPGVYDIIDSMLIVKKMMYRLKGANVSPIWVYPEEIKAVDHKEFTDEEYEELLV